MTTKFSFIFLFILFAACSSDSNGVAKETASNKATETQIIEEAPAQELIQRMLDLPKWQWVYHPEVSGRLPVKVMKNDLVHESYVLTKYKQRVQILSKEELKSHKTQGHVEIKELKFRGDTTYFVMEYSSEGAIGKGRFIMKNKEWVIDEYTVVEYVLNKYL